MIELKIISDGTPDGTKIVNSVTGEKVEGIKGVEWSIKYGEFAVALIELEACCVELSLPKHKIVKPKKKSELLEARRKTIDWEDDIPF